MTPTVLSRRLTPTTTGFSSQSSSRSTDSEPATLRWNRKRLPEANRVAGSHSSCLYEPGGLFDLPKFPGLRFSALLRPRGVVLIPSCVSAIDRHVREHPWLRILSASPGVGGGGGGGHGRGQGGW